MAKRDKSSNRGMQEYQPDQARPGSAPTGQFIEFDPTGASGTARSGTAALQPQGTADTLLPHDDFFKARDKLQEMMGGFRARAAAFSTSVQNLSGMENVVGFGVGFRFSGNTLCGDIAAKVYVREKLPLAQVHKAAQVPPKIDGIDTDVEAIGEVLLHSYAKRFPRPVPCGVSVSNIDLNGSGTIGCLVVLHSNKLCILSNNHVLANENAASIGDSIIQPGNAEPSPAPDQVIGTLEQFIPIQATGNLVDAAVALTSLDLVSPAHVTYHLNPTPLAATLGLSVIKNGRTTQSTMGVVTDMGVNISVAYDPFPAGAEMKNQIAIRGVGGPFSKSGDSGSLIVTAASKQPVALLFAGSDDNSVTFANPIDAVMAALGIDRFLAP